MAKMLTPDLSAPIDGRQSERALAIQRGVMRFLSQRGFSALPEVTLKNGRRADLMAMNKKGEIWIIEIKSSEADLKADSKWPDYLDYCDRFYFAANHETDEGLFPTDQGFILADAHGADIVREADLSKLAAARRKALTLGFARLGAQRLHKIMDPGVPTHIGPHDPID